MTTDQVVVTGIGLTTPAGLGVEPSWRGLCSGTSTAAADPALASLPVPFSCRIADSELAEALPRRIRWRVDRFIQLALVTAREAVADAALDPHEWPADRVGVVIGSGGTSLDHAEEEHAKVQQGRYRAVLPTTVPRSQPNMAAGEVAADLGARGPNFCTSTACASGATAIGVAKILLETGNCDIVLAGGSDSVRLSRLGAVSFWRLGALSERADDPARASRPFDAHRDGFVLGEGAGVLVLERAAHAAARGARPYAVLAGHGFSGDAYHCVAPDPDGNGALRALQGALTEAAVLPADIDHVNAHGTSTPLNDLAEARMLRKAFGDPPPVTATKSLIGHALGGAGAIEAVCSVLSLERQTIHPTANLEQLDPDIDLDVITGQPRRHRMNAVVSNSFGFGGQNCALVFNTP